MRSYELRVALTQNIWKKDEVICKKEVAHYEEHITSYLRL